MWVIQFQVRCDRIRLEYSSLTAGDAAGRVESALSVALLELCRCVEVGAVSVAIEADTAADTAAETADVGEDAAVDDEREVPRPAVRAATVPSGHRLH